MKGKLELDTKDPKSYVHKRHPGGRPKVENPFKPVPIRLDQHTIDVIKKRAEIENTHTTAMYRQAVELGLLSTDDQYPEEARLGEGYPHKLGRLDD